MPYRGISPIYWDHLEFVGLCMHSLPRNKKSLILADLSPIYWILAGINTILQNDSRMV